MKKMLAMLLAASMLVTSIPSNVFAATADDTSVVQVSSDEETQTGEKETVEEPTDTVSTSGDVASNETNTDDANADGTNTDEIPSDVVQGDENASEQDALVGTETEEVAETEEDAETEDDTTTSLINYALVMEPSINKGETESILVGIGEDGTRISSATITVLNKSTGLEIEVSATQFYDALVKFDMTLNDAGEYIATKLVYEVDETESGVDLIKAGIEASFGVGEEIESNPDYYIMPEEEVSAEDMMEVVQLDENGNYVDTTIEEALATSEISVNGGVANSSANQESIDSALIICLDPGHGGSDGGAVSVAGTTERDLVLKIATYCKKELEQYRGVKVIMTRTDNTSACMDRESRCLYAKNNGASVIISFHLNSSTSSSAKGVEIYYPNANYRSDLSNKGKALAQSILNKLVALGLYNRGVVTRNSSDSKYPDGSTADYLGINYWSKLYGIPGILIEHAFLNNASEYNTYLSTDAKLKALGVADATGIAQYYNLSKGGIKIDSAASTTGNSVDIKWTSNSRYGAYNVYRQIDGVDSDFVKIGTAWGTEKESYTDTNVSPGQKIYYKLSTTTNSVESSLSESVTVCIPQTTTILSVTPKQEKKVSLKWSKTGYTTGYEIFRSDAVDGEYTKVATITSSDTVSFDVTVPENSVEYYFKIRAYRTAGGVKSYGNYSGTVSGMSLQTPGFTELYSVEGSKVMLKWDSVVGATGYYIYKSLYSDKKFEKLETIVGGDINTYIDSEVVAGKKYYYKVRAYFTVDETTGFGAASSATGVYVVKKTAITSVSATGSESIKVSWSKAASANGYRIYRSTDESGEYELINSVTGASTVTYTDATVSCGVRYYYKVVAINSNRLGCGVAEESDVRSCKTLPAPVAGEVSSYSRTGLKVTWNAVEGATKYRVYRSEKSTSGYKLVKTTDSETLYVNDSSRTVDKMYYYKIRAYDAEGYSSCSEVISGKSIDVVKITKVSSANGTDVTITWSKVSYKNVYQIFRYNAQTDDYDLIAEVDGSVNSYVDAGLSPSFTYKYKIRVGRLVNEEMKYGRFSAVGQVSALDAPVIVSASSSNSSTVVVKWNQVEGATSYRVYRRESSEIKNTLVAKITKGTTVSFTDKNVSTNKIYYYTVYAYASNSKSEPSAICDAVVLAKSSITSVVTDDTSADITWKAVNDASGYEVWRMGSNESSYVCIKRTNASVTEYTDTTRSSGISYSYKVRAYATVSTGECYSAMSKEYSSGYAIMGTNLLTKTQMVAFYRASGATYNSGFYSKKGAATIGEFVDIVIAESAKEGVRAEVVWAQIILETGYLQFKNCQVSYTQCNFSGLGATDDGAAGATFKDIATGVRAQVQHLKGYASKQPLNTAVVDPRWALAFGANGNGARRGVAPVVEKLGNGNWATDPLYASKLLNILKRIKASA